GAVVSGSCTRLVQAPLPYCDVGFGVETPLPTRGCKKCPIAGRRATIGPRLTMARFVPWR
ncbi:unnamed protein product, partial [marine sediment metagenome]